MSWKELKCQNYLTQHARVQRLQDEGGLAAFPHPLMASAATLRSSPFADFSLAGVDVRVRAGAPCSQD